MVLEDTTERTADQVNELLSALYKSNVITPNQMNQVSIYFIHTRGGAYVCHMGYVMGILELQLEFMSYVLAEIDVMHIN